MKRSLPMLAAVAVAAGLSTSSARAEGDPAEGERVFNQCRACHSLEAGQHRVGPSLHGVFGRKAGMADGFNRYSDALKNADITWDDETMAAYIADPRGYIPGNRMPYPGLKSEQKRQDLIAYLRQATQ